MVNLTSSTLSIAQAETLVEIPNLAALLTPEIDSRISAAEVIKRQPIDPRVSKITPFETTTLAVVNQELETSITISASKILPAALPSITAEDSDVSLVSSAEVTSSTF